MDGLVELLFLYRPGTQGGGIPPNSHHNIDNRFLIWRSWFLFITAWCFLILRIASPTFLGFFFRALFIVTISNIVAWCSSHSFLDGTLTVKTNSYSWLLVMTSTAMWCFSPFFIDVLLLLRLHSSTGKILVSSDGWSEASSDGKKFGWQHTGTWFIRYYQTRLSRWLK